MHRLSMASIFRDETRYLREWIEYHLLVGADHVFLLCNDDPGEHAAVSAVLGPYVDAGVVTWSLFANRSKTWQTEGWEQILAEWGHLTDWMCLTDADAFLFPVRASTVLPVLDEFDRPDVAGLGVFLSTFGSSNLEKPPALQLESFRYRAPLDARCNWTANYILRPARLGPQEFRYGYRTPAPGMTLIDTDGESVGKGKRQGPLDRLRLNHYSVRSREDWARKVRRGWPEATWTDPNHKIEDHKLKMLDRNEVYDAAMMRFVPELRQRLGL